MSEIRESDARLLRLPPDSDDVKKLERMLLRLFFPKQHGVAEKPFRTALAVMVTEAMSYQYPEKSIDCCMRESETAVEAVMDSLGSISDLLWMDAQAGFDGDPAAKNIDEVIICYPALRTLAVHRVAHLLYEMDVPLIPRMMNETMHSETGIDIHPGATIGKSFFIDHGTGVVIGETTVIGDNVKLYQGVTLGALSIPKKGCGSLLEGAKRHPTIEDNVTIYANATILGDVTIGHGSIIASSAWIKDSIPPMSMVITARPDIKVRPRRSI